MGTDNVFKNRKKQRDLKRNRQPRERAAKILIVCEGEKTEPNYFQNIVDAYKLPSAHVTIKGLGGDPNGILKCAQERYEDEKRKGDPFDAVYCVFDKDSHPSYQATLEKIKQIKKPRDTYFAIISVPCFEYWLLLHFKYSNRAYHASGKRSIANQVIKDLEQFIPDYSKNTKDFFKTYQDKTNYAIKNAKKAVVAAEQCGTDNPTTNVYVLVEKLMSMKK